jgi:murein DD-endopeptidase MepM/ murein hydrolase activator NlpD
MPWRHPCHWFAARSSAWLTVGLCAVVLGASFALPSAAAGPALGRDVTAARADWTGSLADRDEAALALTDAEGRLSAAEAALEEARVALHDAKALLAARVEATAAARTHHAAMVVLRVAAGQDVATAARVHDRMTETLDNRQQHLANAAVAAYIHGDPTLRRIVSLVRALDSASSLSGYLAGVEQLHRVTVDARGRYDVAQTQTDHAVTVVDDRLDRLASRRRAERQAVAVLTTAEQAEEDQRDIVAELDTLVADRSDDVASHAAAVEAAQAELAARENAVSRALAAVQALGWRAGVPGSGGLTWPVDGPPGSGFGPRLHPILEEIRPHNGVDVTAPTGTPIVAAAAGRVVHAGPNGDFGNAVIIAHPGGRRTLYAHMHTVEAHVGRNVSEAERIGTVGSTGMSTAPHLHFEVHERGRPRDPLRYFGRGR